MSADKAYDESEYGPNNHDSNSSTRTVSIWPPSVPHNCPSLWVSLPTRKRTAVKTFAAGKLVCCTVPRAKPVVTGSTEPANTVVAGDAATEIANSDDKLDGNEGTSFGVWSGKAARDKNTMY